MVSILGMWKGPLKRLSFAVCITLILFLNNSNYDIKYNCLISHFLHQPLFFGLGDEFRGIGGIKFYHQLLPVPLNSRQAQAYLVRDLRRSQTFSYQAKYLILPLGQHRLPFLGRGLLLQRLLDSGIGPFLLLAQTVHLPQDQQHGQQQQSQQRAGDSESPPQALMTSEDAADAAERFEAGQEFLVLVLRII